LTVDGIVVGEGKACVDGTLVGIVVEEGKVCMEGTSVGMVVNLGLHALSTSVASRIPPIVCEILTIKDILAYIISPFLFLESANPKFSILKPGRFTTLGCPKCHSRVVRNVTHNSQLAIEYNP
jgi:hypothetical protein